MKYYLIIAITSTIFFSCERRNEWSSREKLNKQKQIPDSASKNNNNNGYGLAESELLKRSEKLPKITAELINLAMRGNSNAKSALMIIASDVEAKRMDREIAIRYLSNEGSSESLTVIVKQLASPDPQLRTTSYYCLPDHLRPSEFDYTAEPNAISKQTIENLLRKISK